MSFIVQVNVKRIVLVLGESHCSSPIRRGLKSQREITTILTTPMDRIPPGIRYLLINAPKFWVGDLLTYIAQRLVEAYVFYPRRIPSSVFWFGVSIGWVLVAIAAKIIWKSIVVRRAAELVGADLPPRWIGNWPGNLDNHLEVLKNFHYGYLGKEFLDILFLHLWLSHALPLAL